MTTVKLAILKPLDEMTYDEIVRYVLQEHDVKYENQKYIDFEPEYEHKIQNYILVTKDVKEDLQKLLDEAQELRDRGDKKNKTEKIYFSSNKWRRYV